MDNCCHTTSDCGCSCSCGCGNDHHHGRAKNRDLPELILGAALFAGGLILNAFALPGWIAFVLAYVVLGRGILLQAGKNLVKGRVLDENFLMSIATLGAFAIGEFPEAVGVMLFYRVGEFFEEKAVEHSRRQIIQAVDMRPETVQKIHGDHVHTVPAETVQAADVLLVRPGDRIPLDGVVLSGESYVDTAPITGEPMPRKVHPGEQVLSGCVNGAGQLTIRVEKPLSESMVTRILNAVENAAAGKPKMDRLITRFARIYTPAVVAIAVLAAVVPSVVTGNWSYWVYTALSFLVMSCPCALVLSVPLAFFSGIGAGSKKGILFKSGLTVETLAQIRAVAVDKTGTVTKGEFRVQPCKDSLLQLCASCEQGSTHPIAQSIVASAKKKGLQLDNPTQLEEIPGHGVCAVLKGSRVLCGNEKLLQRYGVEVPPVDKTGSLVHIATDQKYVGCLVVADTLKPEAGEAIRALQAMGIHTAMLTGDTRQNANAVAQMAGISEVFAQLLPEEKLTRLQQIRVRFGKTMFVGDGINDAPVLAGADVGAAMGSGADAAMEAADVVYMTSRADAIVQSVLIARKTRQVVWQNMIFALAVKLTVMVMGLLGYACMWIAVFADSGVAMLCVLNAAFMLYKRK